MLRERGIHSRYQEPRGNKRTRQSKVKDKSNGIYVQNLGNRCMRKMKG